jgi:ribosomal protein S18 acetylase RimI-like enzyme
MSSIRHATRADLRSIVDLAIQLGRQHQSYDPARFRLNVFGGEERALRATYETFFEEALVDRSAVVLVATRADQVVGYAFGRVEPASFVDLCDEAGWVHDLCVSPELQGSGLGARLLDGSVDALRALGAREILLSAAPKNGRANALFARKGFVRTMVEMRLAPERLEGARPTTAAPSSRKVRPVSRQDIPAIRAVIDSTGLFPGHLVDGMIAPFFEPGSSDCWLTYDDGGPAAVAYYAPERLTDGTWNLYLIAVDSGRQGRGIGATLLAHIERDLRERGQRVLIVETSALPELERTRAFYVKQGYAEEARIRDFYQAGEDKVVFWKRLASANVGPRVRAEGGESSR